MGGSVSAWPGCFLQKMEVSWELLGMPYLHRHESNSYLFFFWSHTVVLGGEQGGSGLEPSLGLPHLECSVEPKAVTSTGLCQGSSSFSGLWRGSLASRLAGARRRVTQTSSFFARLAAWLSSRG